MCGNWSHSSSSKNCHLKAKRTLESSEAHWCHCGNQPCLRRSAKSRDLVKPLLQVWLCTRQHDPYIAPAKQMDGPFTSNACNAYKHANKPSCLVNRQNLGMSSTFGSFKCSGPNIGTMILHNLTFTLGMWTHSCVINKIINNSTWKHQNSRSSFLVRGEANLTKGVPFAFDVIIMVYHSNPQNFFAGYVGFVRWK